MHPIERLRYVARVEGAGATALAMEAAGALIGFADEPQALVTACRRLVGRHLEIGPMWWLATRVLLAPDPASEARRVAGELDADPSPGVLAADVPTDCVVAVVGWPELAAGAASEGDLEVLVVDSLGDGPDLVRRLGSSGVDSVEVPESGLGPAVAEAGLLLLEASALGPGAFLASPGSLSAASVARSAGVPVWLVAGRGRVLAARLWENVVARLLAEHGPAWERPFELVPLSLVDSVRGPKGAETPSDALGRANWQAPPELLRTSTA